MYVALSVGRGLRAADVLACWGGATRWRQGSIEQRGLLPPLGGVPSASTSSAAQPEWLLSYGRSAFSRPGLRSGLGRPGVVWRYSPVVE